MEQIARQLYCPNCGVRYWHNTDPLFKVTCGPCQHVQYFNRSSVVVLLVPDPETKGLWIGKRAIPPREGLWCLPSGHSERGATLVEDATRETFEELCITVDDPHRNIRVVGATTATGNRNDLIFMIADPRAVTVHDFKQNTEVSERACVTSLTSEHPIAFPLHYDYMVRYLNKTL